MNIDVLNLYAAEILSGNLLDKYQPFEGLLDEAVQIETKNQDAFNLKMVAGAIKTVSNEKDADVNSYAIIRVPIGYTLASRFETDKQLFNYMIYNYINKALGAFTRQFGNLKNKTVTCEWPGSDGKYFNNLQDSAAIELRFFVDEKK